MYGILGCGFVCLLLIIPIPNGVFAASADVSCVSPVTLLEGRRKIEGVKFTASNSMILHSPSEAMLSGNAWCSGQLGADIFDPYLEVDFGTDVMFTSIMTEGFGGPLLGYFLKRYQVELAREDGHLWYIARNSSSSQAAIFPLDRIGLISDQKYTEQLPMPLIGQTLRIDPYQWSDNDHACTKLEVYGCPLLECRAEDQLGNNANTVVTVNGAQINHDDLFNFGFIAQRYCVPTDTRPPTLKISFASTILITRIIIRGQPLPLPLLDQYVQEFSLSYIAEGKTVNYTRANGLAFRVPDSQSHYFTLWPPIRASQLLVTIRDWQVNPCLNFWMSGCASSNVVEHSIDPSASTAGLVDDPVVTETSTETVIVPTTVFVTTTVTMTDSPSSSTTIHPIPTRGASTLCSNGDDDDDDDNTPIYVSIGIVVAGVFVTAIIVVLGVIKCRRNSRSQIKTAKSTDPLIPRSYGSVNAPPPGAMGVVDNDLYGRPEIRPSQTEEDSDEEPLPLHDEPPNDPIYDEPPRQLRRDGPPDNGTNNPTYGVQLSGEHSTSNIYSEQLTQ